jgi:predicted ATPase
VHEGRSPTVPAGRCDHGVVALREVRLEHELSRERYPFGLPAVRSLPLRLADKVTVLVGENGSGKSTLIEAIAVAAGFNPEGGSFQARFETTPTHSQLAHHLRLVWSPRLEPGWFLRAESFYNVASFRDATPGPPLPSYHEMSHGESFLEVARNWFSEPRLFMLDEPEAALSFTGQLALVQAMLDGSAAGAQFIMATHSPLLMAFPEALLYELDGDGLTDRDYDDLQVVQLWRNFLDAPQRFLHHLG